MTEIEIRGVFERDIDLFLLEELVASPTFLKSFLTAADLSAASELVSATRSVNTSNGESDLELNLLDGSIRIRVLIENKVDATLQPLQGERYAQRAAAYLAAGVCDATRTVLVAPKSYGSSEKFDRCIAYEAVTEWLATAELNDARRQLKTTLMREALERGATGWTLVPSRSTTLFWQSYWTLASTLAPELAMPNPGPKPATSSFVTFRPVQLASGVQLLHKVPYGNVDLQFAALAEHARGFAETYGGRLEPGMVITKAGKSVVVRIVVPRVPLEQPFEESEPVVRLAIEQAQRLLHWYTTNSIRTGAT